MTSSCSPRPLPRSFFSRAPEEVAPRLLGQCIVRRIGAATRIARIVETEAYRGRDDAAAHACVGLTPRTAILYGPAGYAYIYLIYGLHWCLNVSTQPDGIPGGVLFRAAELTSGENLSGPGRLTRGLNLTASQNGCDLTRATSPLYVAESGWAPLTCAVSVRVGIRKATALPFRFFLENHPAVSRPRGPVLARRSLRPSRSAAPIAPRSARGYTPATTSYGDF